MGVAKRREDRRLMMFGDAHSMWTGGRLTQERAAELPGVSARTFRRWTECYGEDGIEGLRDRRVSRASHRAAPVDEVMAMVDRYETDHDGWYVRHFHRFYLDAGTHAWVPGESWDLVVTMDDATSEHHSMFPCAEEGTWSSFLGIREAVQAKGLFCSLYTDRAPRYWTTPEAGGKVDKANPTQFGRALASELGIEMIPAYSPEARGRSERAFRTHQGRLPRELALAGITDMESANRYIREVYMPRFNAEFARPPREAGSAFVPMADPGRLDTIEVRGARVDGGARQLRGLRGPGAATAERPAPSALHEGAGEGQATLDGHLSVWHGPRLLQGYGPDGGPVSESLSEAA